MAGLGKKTFTAGEVLTAADVNGYLMEQSVMVFGGTAARSSAVPTPSEGMVTYLSDLNDIQAYDGSNWISTGLTAGTTTANYGWPIPASGSIASLGTAIDTTVAGLGSGLTLVKSQTIGSAVSSVAVTGVFSATYDAYKIIVSGSAVSSASSAKVNLTLGASTASYNWATAGVNHAGGANDDFLSNGGSIAVGWATTDYIAVSCDVINPFLAKYTLFMMNLAHPSVGLAGSGVHKVATSYSDFTLTPSSGTLTGGLIRVYGYKLS